MPSPPITEELKAEAKRTPNGYVYVIDNEYSDSEEVPETAILGTWKVDMHGVIEGVFIPNPIIGIEPTNFHPMISN